jgi:hypothetical protein
MKHIIHNVKKWISGAKPASGKTTIVYVMASPKQGQADMYAGDPTPILRRLTDFSARESLSIVAILPGKPSRKIPDGTRQKEVAVRYATPDQITKVTEHAVKDAGKTSSVVLVTDLPTLEKFAASHHLKTLRIETFERALESVAGPVRRDIRKPQEGGAPRHSSPAQDSKRPQEPKKPESQAQPAKPSPSPAPAPAKVADERKDRDQSVLDLIDPL